jgi:alpha-tubulin suppressor-like RCC1 family protein
MGETEEGPLVHLITDVFGVVLGFVNGIKLLLRLLGCCSRQFKCSAKEVVNNLKVLAAKREGFKLKQGETWPEVLRFIELRDGRMGVSNQQNQLAVPVALTGLRVVQVSTGPFHTAAVTANGELYTFGLGNLGQLGHGTETTELLPRRVEGALAEERVVSTATGSMHTVVLTASGAVFTFGHGAYGELGHGPYNDELSPRWVEALAGHRVVRIAAGTFHTVVLTASGAVLTFGYNQFGQLGRATGQLDSNLPGEVELAALLGGERAVGLTAGIFHTGVVTSAGRLVMFGHK